MFSHYAPESEAKSDSTPTKPKFTWDAAHVALAQQWNTLKIQCGVPYVVSTPSLRHPQSSPRDSSSTPTNEQVKSFRAQYTRTSSSNNLSAFDSPSPSSKLIVPLQSPSRPSLSSSRPNTTQSSLIRTASLSSLPSARSVGVDSTIVRSASQTATTLIKDKYKSSPQRPSPLTEAFFTPRNNSSSLSGTVSVSPASLSQTPEPTDISLRGKREIVTRLAKIIETILNLYRTFQNHAPTQATEELKEQLRSFYATLKLTDELETQLDYFYTDLKASLKSIGEGNSVVTISEPPSNCPTPIVEQFTLAFGLIYYRRLEAIKTLILKDVANIENKTETCKAKQLILANIYNWYCEWAKNCDEINHPNLEKKPILFFSQNSHNPMFSLKMGEQTSEQPVKVIAEKLRNEDIDSDQLRLSVYASEEQGKLYVKNNRTYTAFSRAGIKPTRLIPILPTKLESERPVLLGPPKGNGGVMIVAEKMGREHADITPSIYHNPDIVRPIATRRK